MDITNCGPIVVTGGFGFVGKNLVQDLLDHNVPVDQIHVIGRKVQTRPRIGQVNYHEGDLVDSDAVSKILVSVKPTLIFHTASPAHAGFSGEYYMKANVDATRNLLETAQKIGTKVFVYTSSTTVVDDDKTDLHLVTEEDSPVLLADQRPQVYALSKAIAENLVIEANGRGPAHTLTVSLRPSAIFGADDGVAVTAMIANARAGRNKYQVGDGTNLFDMVYVDNVVQAHLLAADALLREWPSFSTSTSNDNNNSSSSSETKVNGEAFFITNDEPIPFWTFAQTVASLSGHHLEKNQITVIPKPAGMVFAYIVMWLVWIFTLGRVQSEINPRSIRYACRTWTFSVEKAKRRFGYRPAVSVQEGLRRSVPPPPSSSAGGGGMKRD